MTPEARRTAWRLGAIGGAIALFGGLAWALSAATEKEAQASQGGGTKPSGGGGTSGGGSSGGGGGGGASGGGGTPPPPPPPPPPPATDPWSNLKTRTQVLALAVSNAMALQNGYLIPSASLSQVIADGQGALGFAQQIPADSPDASATPAVINDVTGLAQYVTRLEADVLDYSSLKPPEEIDTVNSVSNAAVDVMDAVTQAGLGGMVNTLPTS